MNVGICMLLFQMVFVSSFLAKNHEFDFFVFAQNWPISSCIDWEVQSGRNVCSLPNRKNWTVHGLWPTLDDTKGPSYCDKSAQFDHDAIVPILQDLKLHWTNIRANTDQDNFWKHEWQKHGTCSMQLPSLDSELKYFKKGLDLNAKYPISQYLSEANIYPGYKYSINDIFKAVKKGILGNNPQIECQLIKGMVKPILTQINICFDQNLELMDCDGASGGLFHTCHQYDMVYYPSSESLQESHTGLIWGIIIGLAIVLGIAIYFIMGKCNRHYRTEAYESLL